MMQPQTTEQERRNSTASSISKPLNFGVNQPIYFIKTYNGYHLVDPVMQALGWKRCVASNNIEQCRLRWTELSSQVNYSSFRDSEQMINHIPNNGLISNKLGLLMCLRQYEQQIKNTKNKLPNLLLKDIIPETYVVSDFRERELFIKAFKPGSIWISKPTGMNQGKGIYLVRDLQVFLKQFNEKEREFRNSTISRNPMPRIVQRYIERPLLLDGRKFDIRCFMVIANTYPYLVLYHPGYVRLSIQKYSTQDTDLATHLTNQYIQKKVPCYQDNYEDTVWSMQQLNDYINANYHEKTGRLEKNWVFNYLEPRMMRIMCHVFNSVKNKLASRFGFFEMFGFDFMIDEDFKISLIEVNTNPAMHTNCKVLNDVLPELMEKSLYVCLECFERVRKRRALLPLKGLVPWTEQTLSKTFKSATTNQDEVTEPIAQDPCADSAKIYRWIRNPYNGLPSGFTILFSEASTMAQMRAAQSMSIPMRPWVCPRFCTPSALTEAKLMKVASDSSSDEEPDSVTVSLKNVVSIRGHSNFPRLGLSDKRFDSGNSNSADYSVLLGTRNTSKPKPDVVPYREQMFEHSLRKYPGPGNRRQSYPLPVENNATKNVAGQRPLSNQVPKCNYMDKKVSEVYKSTIDEREDEKPAENKELLPSPDKIEKRSKPLRQFAVNNYARLKKDLPTRVPFQMTTVQVVTNGSNDQNKNNKAISNNNNQENIMDNIQTSHELDAECPAKELIEQNMNNFPKRSSLVNVKNGLGYNILQLLDGSADLNLRKDSIYRSTVERKQNRNYVDRSC